MTFLTAERSLHVLSKAWMEKLPLRSHLLCSDATARETALRQIVTAFEHDRDRLLEVALEAAISSPEHSAKQINQRGSDGIEGWSTSVVVQQSEGCGRGVFSTAPVHRGDLLLIERPFCAVMHRSVRATADGAEYEHDGTGWERALPLQALLSLRAWRRMLTEDKRDTQEGLGSINCLEAHPGSMNFQDLFGLMVLSAVAAVWLGMWW